METITLIIEKPVDFQCAKTAANKSAEENLEDAILLSWYDKIRDMESPNGVSECHDACDVPGAVEYAENRGGKLVVDINQGDYLFCYREVGEFA